MSNCVICEVEDDSRLVCIREKGSKGINEAAKKRGDSLSTTAGQYVHQKCREKYINPIVIALATKTPEEPTRSSRPQLRSQDHFNFSTQCLFCGVLAKKDKKRTPDVYPVRTLDFQENIIQLCESRRDEWGLDVLGRIKAVNDLHAADAVYHQKCSINFRTNKGIPLCFSPDIERDAKRGRPSSQEDDFREIVSFLDEHPDEQVTINQLVEKMDTLCGQEAFSPNHMKQRLLKHYKEDIVIVERWGTRGIVTLRSTAKSILHDFYVCPKDEDLEAEKTRIITTAAKLLKSEIRSTEVDRDFYPSAENLASKHGNLQYVSDGLQLFLNELFSEKDNELKITAVGQALMQATRPRSLIAPLQLGLAVQLHHNFGSRNLVDELSSLGFCSSYSEVQKFEISAAMSKGITIPGYKEGACMQFIADNVDHNIATLDGKETFHGMGIVAGITPATNTADQKIRRINSVSGDINPDGHIVVKYYKPPTNAISTHLYGTLEKTRTVDATRFLDAVVSITWPLRAPTPGWSGVWQMSSTMDYPGKTSVVFLPMIDLNPSDPTCIYTTMDFVAKQASGYGCTPILTFDQPLYWKAYEIRANEEPDSLLKKMVLRLGGFHMCMSFLGSIGHIMQGSGLQEVLELVYATNAVPHILSGKAVSRATRAHMLVETALHLLGQSKMDATDAINDPCRDEVHNLFKKLLSGDMDVETMCNNERVKQYCEHYLTNMEALVESTPTARLWGQYMDMVTILKTFIKAERTGQWELHLQSVREMLPFFAASGHNLYTKSSYMYLTEMSQLSKDHPDVYDKFMNCHHAMRRSERSWAGLSTDLVIEQVLMRSLKTSGGLTRGRGMSETQRLQWLLSMPACSKINSAMCELTGSIYASSEQHKEAGHTRMQKDKEDILLISSFLKERDPFLDLNVLRNIETGVIADKSVNVDRVRDVGEGILQTMEGQCLMSYSFKRSLQVKQINTKNMLRIGEDSLQVDPQLLFQRFLIAANSLREDLSEVFKYELCSMPPALFDGNGLLNEAHKSSLSDFIWNAGDCEAADDCDTAMKFVIDGGSLLHRLPWCKGETFATTCQRYVEFVSQRYPGATVVFDGYPEEPTTKDLTHLRRSKGITSTEAVFDEDMPCRSAKELFLSNRKNKQKFIFLLGRHLQDAGVSVRHAVHDADLLIVRTALDYASAQNVRIVGEDTDLLVLLCHHYRNGAHNVIFGSEPKRGTHKRKVWDIRKTREHLGEKTALLLPAVHALTGCDTTSRMFGIGKSAPLIRLRSSPDFETALTTFAGSHGDKKTVTSAGLELVACLYGAVPYEGLDVLRYRKFGSKVATGVVSVQVKNLPPTSDAATEHLKRAYLQCHYWTTGEELDPCEWGWYKHSGTLAPVKTSKPAAPSTLLKVIRCTCKTGCDTLRCSCRKNGLECSVSCSDCRGVCFNASKTDEDEP